MVAGEVRVVMVVVVMVVVAAAAIVVVWHVAITLEAVTLDAEKWKPGDQEQL